MKRVRPLLPVLLCCMSATPVHAGTLYATDAQGSLFTLDLDTGEGTFQCFVPTAELGGSDEIEYNPVDGRAVVQTIVDRGTQEFELETCRSLASLTPNGMLFSGLEWVGTTLYAAGTAEECDQSALHTLDPSNGSVTFIGDTGAGDITGLAWDPNSDTMYGIMGCTTDSPLFTISLATGQANVVGDTGVGLESLEFGPDGFLYAGGDSADGGNLYHLDVSDGSATLVGPTGFATVTGLALFEAFAGVGGNGPAMPRIAWQPARPNPVLGRTTLTFSLPSAESVRIAIVDASGRRVRGFTGEFYAPGLHEIPWDGTDDAGHPVAAGVFFGLLQAQGETAAQKLIVVR